MDYNSPKLLKGEQKTFKVIDFIPLKFFFSIIFLIIIIIMLTVTKFIFKAEEKKYKENIYAKSSKLALKSCDDIYKNILNDTIIFSNTLSKHYNINKALLLNDSKKLNLKSIIKNLNKQDRHTNYRIEIIDKHGKSFQKSWDQKYSKNNIDYMKLRIMKFIKFPRAVTYLYASDYGYTILNMVPIYNDKEFIGIFISYMHFDDVVSKLKEQGYNAVIVLNDVDSIKVKHNKSYSKHFIEKYYVVNLNSDPYLERVLQQNSIESFYAKWDKEYNTTKTEEYLVSKYIIKDFFYKQTAQVFIFKPFSELDLHSIELMKQWYIMLTVILIISSILIVYYLYVRDSIATTNKENSSLIMINDDLKEKTDQLDYNEKKIENLFNSQPNLMIMHNGVEITSANKRFMGFFNRFGNFNGFKKNYKCVSEFFEKYDAPNYIWEQYIEGEYWIDYILKNPRRLYKIVMSIANRQGEEEQHHFIIKLNEIKYAGIVSERLIIVALVDITQDMKNYKSLEELSVKKEDTK